MPRGKRAAAPANENPSQSEEIRMGVQNAALMMPADSQERRALVQGYYHALDEEKQLVAEAKTKANAKENLDRLHKKHGVLLVTAKILRLLEGIKKHGDRAACLAQVNLLAQDLDYTAPDLVDMMATVGQTAGTGAPQKELLDEEAEKQPARGGRRKAAAATPAAETEEEAPPAAPVAAKGRGGRPRKDQTPAPKGGFRDSQKAENAKGDAHIKAAADRAEQTGAERRAARRAAAAAGSGPALNDEIVDEAPPAAPIPSIPSSGRRRGLAERAVH